MKGMKPISLVISLLALIGTAAVALMTSEVTTIPKSQISFEPIRRATKVVLYEGLPHQGYEPEKLKQERARLPTVEFLGYPFYEELLPLTDDDALKLTDLIALPRTYELMEGVTKLCGGFHPDYAIEWQVGTDNYRGLICFGCGEAKFTSPSGEWHVDLDQALRKELHQLLNHRQQNRPPGVRGP